MASIEERWGALQRALAEHAIVQQAEDVLRFTTEEKDAFEPPDCPHCGRPGPRVEWMNATRPDEAERGERYWAIARLVCLVPHVG